VREDPYLTAVMYDLFREALKAEAKRIDLRDDGLILFFDEDEKCCPISPDWTTLCQPWEFQELSGTLIKYIKSMGGVASPHPCYPQEGRFLFKLPFGKVQEQIGCRIQNTPSATAIEETLHIELFVRPWINPLLLIAIALIVPIWTGTQGFYNSVGLYPAWIGLFMLHIAYILLPKPDPARRLASRVLFFILIAQCSGVAFCIGSWVAEWSNSTISTYSYVGTPIVGVILMSAVSKLHDLITKGQDSKSDEV